MMKTWAFWSVAGPLSMTVLCLLFLAGVSALLGAPADVIALNFLYDALEPLFRVTVQLWVTAFFMMAACYGVSRQLIRRTLKNPLSAPLAELAARISCKFMLILPALAMTTGFALRPLRIFLPFRTDTPRHSPLPALSAGAMPRLE